MRTVGVLGGMGPDATVDFMAKVVKLTPADTDQDNVRMLVDCNPHVPDRQIDTPEQRLLVEQVLADMAVGLQRSGAEFLVMPCNTAHDFIAGIKAQTSIPFVHIVTETVATISASHPHAKSIGLLATDLCLKAGLYDVEAERHGMVVRLPNSQSQIELMELVGRIKKGDQGEDVVTGMRNVAQALIVAGADVIVAGCTEIPLVLSQDTLSVPLISSTDVLASRTVELCLGRAPLPNKQ